LCVTLPLMSCGIWILSDVFAHAQGSWVLFFLLYLLCLLCNGLFFMMLPFHYRPFYFWNNIWPRRLSWLLNLGALFYTWHSAYTLNAPLALAMLCNPFTYMAEGLRSALLAGPQYLPAPICTFVIVLCGAACWLLLIRDMKKRLDPV